MRALASRILSVRRGSVWMGFVGWELLFLSAKVGTIPTPAAVSTTRDVFPNKLNPCLEYTCSPRQICTTTVRTENSICDDGLGCTRGEVCREGSCVGDPDDGFCEDDVFCNGVEICQPAHPEADAEGCRRQAAPTLADGVDCTLDRCDEEGDMVTHVPDHTQCSDGLFCTGEEVCDPESQDADQRGCMEGVAPVVDDGVACTLDRCDEEGDTVTHVPDPTACSDAVFCNGEEVCDPGSPDADQNGLP